MKRVVIFGAGAVGRGFIAPLFSAAGWHVTFLDVIPSLVGTLNADGGYDHRVVDNSHHSQTRVAPVDAFLLSDHETAVSMMADADIAATAVGAAHLESLAPLIAAALRARVELGAPTLNILLCENLHDAPSVLRTALDDAAGHDTSLTVGLVSTSIGRMIPSGVTDPHNPMAISAEPYASLPYDASACVGTQPDVDGLIPISDGFDVFSDRKLYVHNMGHCMLAHLGELIGLEYVWQAVERLDLRYLVRGAMIEAASALSVVHRQPIGPFLDHVNDLLHRFGNRALADTTQRVGRDPERKMQPGDRLLGAYDLCRQAKVAPLHASLAVALGANRLAQVDGWSSQRVLRFLQEHLFYQDEDAVARALLWDQMSLLETGLDTAAHIKRINDEFAVARVL